MNDTLIKVEDLCKIYNPGENEVRALDHVSLEIKKGELVAIIGQSGSGKSTFMNMLGCLDVPTSGKYYLNGIDVSEMTDNELSEVRNREIGFIFQAFNLVSSVNVWENVVLPMGLDGQKIDVNFVQDILHTLNIENKVHSLPNTLSGGQQQRVAIARALATDPKVLLCDEATSALDPNTTRSILELLREINKSLGVTIIVITHEMKVIDQICDRVAVIDKSCIAEEGRVADVFTNPKSDIARELVLPQERPVLDPTTGGRKLRLIFNGEDTQKPVISEMILACRVPVNVLFADTKSVEGAAYGHMILELPNDEHDAEKVVSWLKNSGLTWKEER